MSHAAAEAGRWRQSWYFESSREEIRKETSVGTERSLQRRKRRSLTRKNGCSFLSCIVCCHQPGSCFGLIFLSTVTEILFKFNEPEHRQKIELKFWWRIYICKERIMRQNSVQIHLTLDWSSCPQFLKMHWLGKFPETGRQRIIKTKSWKEDRWAAVSPGRWVTPKDKTNGPQSRTFWLETILASRCCYEFQAFGWLQYGSPSALTRG